MSTPKLLILGALSDIGVAIGRNFAAKGYELILLARDEQRLATEGEHLRVKYGVAVEARAFDVLEPCEEFLSSLVPFPSVVISVVGMMGEHEASARDPVAADLVFRTNFNAPALFLQACAERMPAGGTIVGISSVAGDRGRASNYFYGAAKAGFTAFLSGLRGRMLARGVHVMTVKPGFVRTRMLAGMKTPAALTAEPAEVAQAIEKGIEGKKDVVYVRPAWRLVMGIIRVIPEGKFKTLKF